VVWDIETKKRVISAPFDCEIRAVDWSPSGAQLIVGDYKGFIHLVDADTLKVLDHKGSKFSNQNKNKNHLCWI
jgi:WD40 repeat protein